MSQYYEGRAPRALQRSNQPIAVPQTGITETLNAPGLAFPETQTSRGVVLLGQLQNALGLGANLVSAVASVEANKDREIERLENKKERLQADIEREQRDTDTILRGVQVQAARESLPGILAKIEAGDPAYLPPVSRGGIAVSNEDFAEDLVGRFNAGETDVERGAFRTALIDNVVGALYRREEVLRNKNHAALLNTTLAGASTADAGGLQQATDTLVNRLDVPLPAAKAAVAKSRLDYAVQLAAMDPVGARRALAEATEFSGGTIPEEVLNARSKIENAIEADRRAKSNEILNDMLRQLSEQPVAAVEAQLNRPLISSQMDGSDVFRLRQAIDAKKDEMRRETIGLIVQAQKAEYDEAYQNIGVALSSEKGAGGGLYRLEDRKVTLANGQEYTLKASETKQAIADQAWQEARNDPNPAQAFGQMVEWVSRNGVIPTEWDQNLNNAGLQASLAQIVPPRDVGTGYTPPVKLPPNLQQAYEQYKMIRAVSPGVAARAMKDATTESLFDLAAFAETLPQFGSGPGAMAAALHVANQNQKYGAAEPSWRDIQSRAEDIGGGNVGYVRDELQRSTKFYMRLNGVTQEQALSQAEAAFRKNNTKLNGNWVYTRSVADASPALLESVVPIIAKNYVNTRGDDEGVRAKDLTLIPIGPNQWALSRADLSSVESTLVEDLQSGTGTFTTQQLYEIIAEREGISMAAAKQKFDEEFAKRGVKHEQRAKDAERDYNRIVNMGL